MSFSRKKNIDRRVFGRMQMREHAWVHCDGLKPVPCIVRNISRSGALLEFLHAFPPPMNLALQLEGHRALIKCEIRHYEPPLCGVRFLLSSGKSSDLDILLEWNGATRLSQKA